MKTETIAMVVTPEAEAFIDELGVRRPYEQIVEHLRQTIPGLYEINVERDPPYDLGGDDVLLIRGYRTPMGLEDDRTDRNVGQWVMETFPYDTFRHFVFYSVEVSPSAG